MSAETTPLHRPIQYLKGVGPKLGQLLAKKGIQTLEDAVYFAPRTYEDRRRIVPIGSLVPGSVATVFGQIVSARNVRRGRKAGFEACLADGSGNVILYWFHSFPTLKDEFVPGACFLIHGTVDFFGGRPWIRHPDYEKAHLDDKGKPLPSAQFGRIVPVYSETEGLHQKTLRRIVGQALKETLPHLEDPLPASLLARLELTPLRESVARLHYPLQCPTEDTLPHEARRLIFEEFFALQLGLLLRKKERGMANAPRLLSGRLRDQFLAALPFQLTQDQTRVLEEIRKDLEQPIPMVRLVQGDVGSGKTVVALASAAVTAESGYQTALMAPTEILAVQHYKAAQRWLAPLGIASELVVSANSSRQGVREAVQTGKASVVVGTHALFQQGLEFHRLGLVVVDEQHRFGVEQRAELMRKARRGETPHLLSLTATPIPRTLALTCYGDLDLSVIREKPADRRPIETCILSDRERPRLYREILAAMQRGEQIYIIYPLIESSEKLDLKSATDMHGRLSREIFPQFQIALLHGRMKPEEKEAVLTEFRDGKYHCLVSTTVIEVGIDVPNATLMVIEHPERLGLSQLHQLRGRVGRGSKASRCLLVAGRQVTERLQVLVESDDGFRIAEEDLRLRGPGEFLGTRQSGLPGFRIGHIVRDASLLAIAREEAERLLKEDPELRAPEHRGIRKLVETRWREKFDRLKGG